MKTRYFFSILLLFFCFLHPVATQEAAKPDVQTNTPQQSATPTGETLTEEQVAQRRQQVAAELETATKTVESVSGTVNLEFLDQKKQHVQLLSRIQGLLAQQSNTLKQVETLTNAKNQLDEQVKQVQASGVQIEKTEQEGTKYGFAVLDDLRTQLRSEKEKSIALEETTKNAQGLLEQYKKTFDEKENTRILAKEAYDKLPDGPEKIIAETRLYTQQLEARVARQQVTLQELEIRSQNRQKEVYQSQIKLYEAQIKWVEPDVVFTQEYLNERLVKIDQDVAELDKNKINAEKKLQEVKLFWDEAIKRVASSISPSIEVIEDEIEKHLQYDMQEIQVAVFEARKNRTDKRRTIWHRRYHLFNGNAIPAEIQEWKEDTNSELASLELEITEQENRIKNRRSELSKVETKIDEQYKDQPVVLKKAQKQRDYLNAILTTFDSNLSSIEISKKHYNRLLEDLNKHDQSWSLNEIMLVGWGYIKEYWDYPIWRNTEIVGDEVQVTTLLTVGKLGIAVTYIVIGLWLSAVFSRFVQRVLQKRFEIDEGGSTAVRSLLFYGLVIFIVLRTLDEINFDITALAFLGGALAIGIGFGSQTIMSNFISGLILLIERPVRVGDLVEVEGTSGTVAHIGLRCTRILTFTNIDVMVPNSYFLENRVVNMTLSDKVIRTTVTVGVAYGSNAREAQKLIKKAVDEHGLILKFPEPWVVFADFGDSALIFEVRFWINMGNNTNRLMVEGDIRHRIYHLFNDAGIVISFPQRDVHLDTVKPLEVRLVPNEDVREDGTLA